MVVSIMQFDGLANRLLGKFEKPLLSAVVTLGEAAYSAALADHLSIELNRKISVGQVSRSLHTMKKLGLIDSKTVMPFPRVQGQRSRLVYSLTDHGRSLLQKAGAIDSETNPTVPSYKEDNGAGLPVAAMVT